MEDGNDVVWVENDNDCVGDGDDNGIEESMS